MISEKLSSLRKQRNLTMRDVAESIGVSLSAYQKYENGTRDVSTEMLSKLADFYHVTTDYLLGRDTGEPEPLDSLVSEFNMTLLERKIVENYLSLPPHMRCDMMEFLYKAFQEVQEEDGE